MSLDDVYRAFAGTPGPATCPARVAPRPRMIEPLGHMGHVGHHEKERQQDTAGPVETLLAALADMGRNLGPELKDRLQEQLRPLSREMRAELVAAVDDVFEVALDTAAARQQAYRLLTNERTLQAAKAVWPAYPDSPEPESDTDLQTPCPGS